MKFEVVMVRGMDQVLDAYINVYLINESPDNITLALEANKSTLLVDNGGRSSKIHVYYFNVERLESTESIPVKDGRSVVNPVDLNPGEAAVLNQLLLENIEVARSINVSYKVTDEYGVLHGVWSGELSGRIEFFDEGESLSFRYVYD